jgi:hypothetical protein
MNFFIKNLINECILIKYSICDDLLLEGFEKNNTVFLNPEDEIRIAFSWDSFYNRGVTQNDYKYTSTFLSIFEDISIEIIDKNMILTKEEIEKNVIKHRKEGMSSHIFTLEIEVFKYSAEKIKNNINL